MTNIIEIETVEDGIEQVYYTLTSSTQLPDGKAIAMVNTISFDGVWSIIILSQYLDNVQILTGYHQIIISNNFQFSKVLQ